MERMIVKDILGQEIFSRESIKRIKVLVTSDTTTLDFRDVTFISRSAVDELLNLFEENTILEIKNIQPEVELMMDVVKRGRINRKRNFNTAKVSTTFFCDNMEEVREALFSGLRPYPSKHEVRREGSQEIRK